MISFDDRDGDVGRWQEKDARQFETRRSIIIPTDIWIHHILPFLEDRVTYNICRGLNREIYKAEQFSPFLPPWPRRGRKKCGHQQIVCVQVSNQGIACADISGRVMLLSRRTGKLTMPFHRTPADDEINCLSQEVMVLIFSKDGQTLAVGRIDGSIQTVHVHWDGSIKAEEYHGAGARDYDSPRKLRHTGAPIKSLLFGGEQSRYLVVLCQCGDNDEDALLEVMDVANTGSSSESTIITSIRERHTDITGIALSPNEKILAAVHSDGSVCLYHNFLPSLSSTTRRRYKQYLDGRSLLGTTNLQFSFDGQVLWGSKRGYALSRWDLTSKDFSLLVWGTAAVMDGQQCVSNLQETTTRNHSICYLLAQHDCESCALRIQRMTTMNNNMAGFDPSILSNDIQTIRVLEQKLCLQFSPAASILVAGGANGDLHLWNVEEEECSE